MKINILRTEIDLDRLRMEMALKAEQTGQFPSYIIMNNETFLGIKNSDLSIHRLFSTKPNYPSFYGCPIALCDKLKFGEVDIICKIN
jgi:hypothetical protein